MRKARRCACTRAAIRRRPSRGDVTDSNIDHPAAWDSPTVDRIGCQSYQLLIGRFRPDEGLRRQVHLSVARSRNPNISNNHAPRRPAQLLMLSAFCRLAGFRNYFALWRAAEHVTLVHIAQP